MIYRMKVTALIPDPLIAEVKRLSKGKNITDSLIIVLQEWIAQHKLKRISLRIKKSPIKFISGYSAENIRSLNRTR